MRLILLGAPGAGKGTQAELLSKVLNVPHISTGDIFRSNIENKTELGMKAEQYINKGLLVPDEITTGIVKQRFENKDCKKGFILDGFPRTVTQAEQLEITVHDMGIELDYVVLIDVSDDEIIKRLSGRRVCSGCGKSYHIIYNPTAQQGICDECKGHVGQRKDDNEETVKKRLDNYHRQTVPLIEYYDIKGKLLTVEGMKGIEDTSQKLIRILGV